MAEDLHPKGSQGSEARSRTNDSVLELAFRAEVGRGFAVRPILLFPLLAAVASTLAWPSGAQVTISNGLAPPNPENVISDDRYADTDVYVRDAESGAPTTVELISGGRIGRSEGLTVLDSSVALVSGGALEPLDSSAIGGEALALDSSHLEVTGGTMSGIVADDNSTVVFSGGFSFNVTSLGDSVLTMSDAAVTDHGVSAFGSSHFIFRGGDADSSIRAGENALVSWYGGHGVSGIDTFQRGVVRIYGDSFSVDGLPAPYGLIGETSGWLTGTLRSGEPVNTPFSHGGLGPWNPTQSGSIVLSPPFPDPMGVVPVMGKEKLLAPSDDDEFVLRVAALSGDGNTAIVGGSASSTLGSPGLALEFRRREDGSWTFGEPLGETTGEIYSMALSGDGDTAVLGDPQTYVETGGTGWDGEVSIFIRGETGGWTLQQKIVVAGEAHTELGYSVDISSSGSIAILGASEARPTGMEGGGSAFIYTRALDGTWSQEQEIYPPEPLFNGRFGSSVAVSAAGDIALVGATEAGGLPGSGTDTGSAHLFSRSSDESWTLEQELIPPGLEIGDTFGYALDLSSSGEHAIVGAPQVGPRLDPDQGGFAHIFSRDSNGPWLHEQKIMAPNAEQLDGFGASVAISSSGDRVIVGVPADGTVRGNRSGSVHLFERGMDGTWSHVREIIPANGSSETEFGRSAVLSAAGDTAVFSASGTDCDSLGTGSAYAFDFPDIDSDGQSNAFERAADTGLDDGDSDGDGLLDGYELGTGTFGPKRLISTIADGARSVHVADIDGDGDADVLSASFLDNKIAWYRNLDGLGNFGTEQPISTSAANAESVYTADIDRDGDLDVLSASSGDDTIAWYENTDGSGAFGSRRIISILADEARSVFAADLDLDGDNDVLSASRRDDKIAWYENTDGSGNFGPPRIISTSADGAYSVTAADMDQDGDLDVLSASRDDDTLAWYENVDCAGDFGLRRVVSVLPDGARSIVATDVDGDGNRDILSASQNDGRIAWYKNMDARGGIGAQQLVSTLAEGARAVFASDIDGDGDADALSASFLDDKIAWYENLDGKGTFGSQLVITTTADGAYSVYTADLDGDGDQDVVSASVDDDTIAWYEQLNVADPNLADTDGDGVQDGLEDPDADGLDNLGEQAAGTHGLVPDTDGDGFSDGDEVDAGTDPLDPSDFPAALVPSLNLWGAALLLALLAGVANVARPFYLRSR